MRRESRSGDQVFHKRLWHREAKQNTSNIHHLLLYALHWYSKQTGPSLTVLYRFVDKLSEFLSVEMIRLEVTEALSITAWGAPRGAKKFLYILSKILLPCSTLINLQACL